jgi:predicted RNA-binding Zn-ribbon protein involved in translation (DUF1610 family)
VKLYADEFAVDYECDADIATSDSDVWLECGYQGVVEPSHISRTLLGDFIATYECPRCGGTWDERF